MGMENHQGPRRRNFGGAERAQHTIRLSGHARRLVEDLRQPGILVDDGCALGDVIERAIRHFCDPVPLWDASQPRELVRLEREWEANRKYQTSVQISVESLDIVSEKAKVLGCSRTDVIEMAVRRLAQDCCVS